MRVLVAILLLVLCCGAALGQRAQMQIAFERDTVAVGKAIVLRIGVRYPVGARLVLLPDTVKAYRPFEVVGTRTVPDAQATEGDMVKDSLEVTLRTWEVEARQTVQLHAAYVRAPGDSIKVTSNAATVRLNTRVPQVVPSLQYRRDFSLAHITEPIDLRPWVIALGVLLALGVIGFFVLRKPFRKWLYRRNLTRRYAELQQQLTAQYAGLAQEPVRSINEINRLWKEFLDADWRAHLRSLTAQELMHYLQQTDRLPQDNKQVLVKLCKLEEQVNYAKMPLASSEFEKLYSGLQQVVAVEFQRRKETAN